MQRLYILVSKYLRTRLVEDPPLVNLAAPQTLRKVRRTNRILAIVFSSNYSLLSDAVRPPQALLSKTICSSHSSSGVLPVSSKFRAVQPHLLASSRPPRRPHGPAFLWRHRGPLEVLAVQPLFWRPRLLRLTICQSCNMKESDSERPVLHTNVHLKNRHLLSI